MILEDQYVREREREPGALITSTTHAADEFSIYSVLTQSANTTPVSLRAWACVTKQQRFGIKANSRYLQYRQLPISILTN